MQYFSSMILLVIVFCYLSSALDCNLPTDAVVNQFLRDEVTSGGGEGGTTTIRGGPYYTCQVQGTTMGAYQELSVIMEYTSGGIDRVGQFEMLCQSSPDDWGKRVESLTVLSQGPGVTYDGSIDLWTNCSSCIDTAGNDNNCVACHSSCNDGLMRCTGSNSDDCCVAFEDDGVCKTDLNCNTNNFVANTENNFFCACGLFCPDGYSLNNDSCTCTLSDICVADNPCNNGGVCMLGSSPDQYTCNCTGTGYMEINCSVCSLDCSAGYVVKTDCTGCVLADICVADNPCNNGGVCMLGSSPDQYTCNCTGTGYNGTNCTLSDGSPTTCTPLDCPNGYQQNAACTECILMDICVAGDNPCLNGGTCMLGSSPNQYTCECTDGYEGRNCATQSGCTLDCQNQGTVNVRNCSCICAEGYTGYNCSECEEGYTADEDDRSSCVRNDATSRPIEDEAFELWWVILVVVLVVLILIAAGITTSVIAYIVYKKSKDGTKV